MRRRALRSAWRLYRAAGTRSSAAGRSCVPAGGGVAVAVKTTAVNIMKIIFIAFLPSSIHAAAPASKS